MVKSNNKIKGGDSISIPCALSNEILSNGLSDKIKKKSSVRLQKQTEKDTKKTEVVDEFLSQKILKQAQEQIEEIASEGGSSSNFVKKRGEKILGAVEAAASDDESVDFEYDNDDLNPDIDESDEQALKKFMFGDVSKTRKLCDIIMEKIDEKRFELDSQMSMDLDGEHPRQKLDPRLLAMYENVGKVLSTYRSGKLPKALKILPKLTNWEQILFSTHPEKWTAAAMYQTTRIFVSNLNVKMCQRFLGLILLPRIRDDIAEYKKLNFHLYRALSKALFKPAAFFKAILLPLCESGTCTLREATIIGSLMTKCSIPSLHAAAAMLKIAEMNYSGSNSLFLRLLIDKKYTLPYRVIDGLVNHFLRFINDGRQLPILWHQSLLVFCQRYKADLSSEQREHLTDLIKKHYHVQISPEVRRELYGVESRDVEDQEPVLDDDNSD